MVSKARLYKMLVRIANREDPYQTASSEAVCSVCLGLFGRQVMFEVLEDLPYYFVPCNTILFCSHVKCQLSRLEFTKILSRIGNSEDPDQTKQSDPGLLCL